MPVFQINLGRTQQTGKTTMALGALERLAQDGVSVVYVLPTLDHVRDFKKRKAPKVRVCSASQWWEGFGADARAIAFDGFPYMMAPETVDKFLTKAHERLLAHEGPTQLLTLG